MNKVLSFDKYISESNETGMSYYLKDYVEYSYQRGQSAKNRFDKKYGYLVTDVELLLKEMVKAPFEKLLVLQNETCSDNQIVENNTREASDYIDECGISPFTLLMNFGEYKHDDKYIMVIHNDMVVSFNEENSPLRNEKYLTWLLYGEIARGDIDAYNICSGLDFDYDLNTEENIKNMTKWFCTKEMADIVLEIYRKYTEHEGNPFE